MLSRLSLLWELVRSSLWFVPALMVLLGVVSAFLLLYLDSRLPERWWEGYRALEGLLQVDSGGASAMLRAIATSVITVAGVVFSIAMVAFAQAGMQYSSRVLRSFMRDRVNQAILGTFLAIYVYCLLVLRVVADIGDGAPAPALATLFGFSGSVVAVMMLIYFIHHVTTSLQASQIVATIAHETLHEVESMFPEAPGQDAGAEPGGPADGSGTPVLAPRDGYLLALDRDALVELATQLGGRVEIEHRAGRFVVAGQRVALIHSETVPDEDQLGRAARAFRLGRQRRVTGDPLYGIREIVDVALRALSPGVNETTTAVFCVNWLGAILARAADRCEPQSCRCSDGVVRLCWPVPDHATLVTHACSQIRQSANGNVAVLKRLMQILELLADRLPGEPGQRALRAQAEGVIQVARETVPFLPDRSGLEQSAARLLGRLRAGACGPGSGAGLSRG